MSTAAVFSRSILFIFEVFLVNSRQSSVNVGNDSRSSCSQFTRWLRACCFGFVDVDVRTVTDMSYSYYKIILLNQLGTSYNAFSIVRVFGKQCTPDDK